MPKETNLAYDLSRYEYQCKAPQKQEKPEIKASKNHQKHISAPKVTALIISFGLLMCCMLYGNVETSRLYNQIASMNKQVDILAGENARMQTDLEGRISVKKVEDYAENVLGLEKLEASQIEYVELSTDSKIEIPEGENNIFVTIKNKYNELVEYLMGE